MKKLILVMICLGVFISCGKKQEPTEPKTETKVETTEPKTETKEEPKETAAAEGRRVNYNCPMDTNFIVEYSADGQTAKLFDESDKIYELKRTEGTDGVYFKNDSGASIHEKGEDLTVELVKGNPIECKVFKQ